MKPYPPDDVRAVALATGDRIVIRPIRPGDEPMMVRFHEGLSDLSVYLRYFHMMTLAQRTSHARLSGICLASRAGEHVIVAEGLDGESGEPAILGVARLERRDAAREAEFAVVVADRVQGLGVGTALMRRIIDVARLDGVTGLRADVLSANAAMRRLCARVGIPLRPTEDPGVVVADLAL